MESERRNSTNKDSPESRNRNSGTIGTVPRNPQQQQRPNAGGRSSLSLNRRSSNPRGDNSSNSNGTTRSLAAEAQQFPSIPPIRFRSVHQQATQLEQDVMLNDSSRVPSLFHNNNISSNDSPSGRTSGTAAAAVRREIPTRHRQPPSSTSGAASSTNTLASGSGSNSHPNRRSGACLWRNNRRNNNGNNNTSMPSPSNRSRGSYGARSRPVDDGDRDFDHVTLDMARPFCPSLDEWMPSDHHRATAAAEVMGLGTEDEPFELLNDSDLGPGQDVQAMTRDEEMARQLQQEEWERSMTPIQPPSRIEFLRALHGAMGDDPPHGRRGGGQRDGLRALRLPVLRGNQGGMPRFALQLPDLFDFLPPQLLDMIISNGQGLSEDDDYEALLEMSDQIGVVNRGLSKREINKIPLRKHRAAPSSSSTSSSSTAAAAPTSSSQDNSSSQCSICLSDFATGEMIRILPCQHELHKNCVDQWLKTNATCPICRKDVKEQTSNDRS